MIGVEGAGVIDPHPSVKFSRELDALVIHPVARYGLRCATGETGAVRLPASKLIVGISLVEAVKDL